MLFTAVSFEGLQVLSFQKERERERERERELSNSIMRLSKQFHACLFFLRKDFALRKTTKMQNKQLSYS